MANNTETEYLLGHGEQEWDRLNRQHQVWKHTLLDALPTLGIGPGSRILEVGCGNGVLLEDLAHVAGPEGHVVGVERDPDAVKRAVAHLNEVPWAQVHQGDLFELEPPQTGFDLVVARWVVAWLPDPDLAVARLMSQLAPGGYLLVQDYDYDAIRVEPRQPGLDLLFETAPKAYALHGGDAWSAVHLPRHYVEAGLEITAIQPHCKAGGPSSDVFQWAERFFREHIQRFVDDGLLTDAQRDACLADWDNAHATPGTVFYSPLVVNVIGRRPVV